MKNTDKASHFIHETVDKIADATNQATDALSEKSNQLMDAEEHMLENCRSYIRDNPITSLGISVAAGFLLSRLLSGR